MIINFDKNDFSKKTNPIEHFYFDLRNFLLKPKIEKIIGFYGVRESSRKFKILQEDELYSEFDLTRLLSAINYVYGDQIEFHHEMMHIIDFIFDQNQYINVGMSIIFYSFFFVPYLL